MSRLRAAALLAAVFAGMPGVAAAQKLDLSVSPRTITFPSANPDTTPTISAAPITVSVRVRQLLPILGQWHLSILANGDLVSGGSTIPLTTITWTATPAPPFQNGAMSRTTAQRMAGGSANVNPELDGSVTFKLVNAWTYTAGTYTQTVVFTLSSP